MWYQDTIPLFEWLVTGPFDFHEDRRVPEEAWKELERVGKEKKIYYKNLRRAVPLDKPDRQDTNLSGESLAYVSLEFPVEPSLFLS